MPHLDGLTIVTTKWMNGLIAELSFLFFYETFMDEEVKVVMLLIIIIIGSDNPPLSYFLAPHLLQKRTGSPFSVPCKRCR